MCDSCAPAAKTTDKVLAILDVLQRKNYRITSARKRIAAFVVRRAQPFSALEAHAALAKEKTTPPDKVTVYRELQLLESEGVIQSVTLRDGVKRYCHSSDGHHHHLVCTGCDAVQDIAMDHDLDAIEKKIGKEKSFTVQSHALEFYGLCKKCS